MEIKQAPSPNFKPGRYGHRPIAIVNHITAGIMPGTLTWLQNSAAKASAHYLVTKKGQIYQMVKDEDTAYHAGIVNKPSWSLYKDTNPNFYTLGIEHEALAGEALTEPQYQNTLWLHRQLIQKWGIPVDRDHIIGHYRIDNVNRPNDPGPNFPWDRLFIDLRGGTTVKDTEKVPCTIDIKGKEFTGYVKGGTAYFQDAPVREVMEAVNNTINWDSKTMTAKIS